MKNINSLDNQQIKKLIKIKKGRNPKAEGLFVIDGLREITIAYQQKLAIKELYYCPEKTNTGAENGENEGAWLLNKLITKTTIVSTRVFDKIAYKEKPDGFLALAERPCSDIKDIKAKQNALVVILDAVEKPGNIGAIIRTAQAAGADAVVINNNQTDIFNPNVIRASEGALFCLPVVVASQEETRAWLIQNKITSFVTNIKASKDYSKVNMAAAAAVILGSEAEGVGVFWLKNANESIKIPMKTKIDSLNVSVSAGIIIFEALRQRQR